KAVAHDQGNLGVEARKILNQVAGIRCRQIDGQWICDEI
ncbi:MAG: hypothetical protein FD128_1369, partial [Hyphomonadaceae bacterium]